MKFYVTKPITKKAVINYISKLPDNKEYKIIITRKVVRRTLPQNRLYWLKIACICDETGSDKEQVHEEFKRMFLPRKNVKTLSGEIIEKPMSTTELSTKQFTFFIEKIDAFSSSELGIILPNPDDLAWEQFYETYKDWV